MSASPNDEAAAAAHDLNGGAVQVAYIPFVIWEGKLGHFRCYVLSTGERVFDADDVETFLATCSIGDLAAELDGMAAPWPMALSRVPKETDEEYLARVAPYLDNEGRARVQEALSERLSAGGLAVPPGGDS